VWSPDGRVDFPTTMSYNRFRDIRRYLRFDDKSTRCQRVSDKLAPVSELWAAFKHNINGAMIPGPFLTVDERLAPFRGRCSFIQYMPSKPAKYGIKLWMCCDAETKYVHNVSIYCGKENTSADKAKHLGEKVVLDLLLPLSCEGRNVTTGNYFTSLQLARQLLKSKISLVGTIRSHRVEVPTEFVTCKGRELYSSLFGFNIKGDCMMTSYKAKKNKVVVMLSTMHNDTQKQSGTKQLPDVISFYNKTKGGVDCADQMIETYSTKFATRRWPVVIFCNLVDIAALNGYVLYNKLIASSNPPMKRRLFLRQRGKELCQPLRNERSTSRVHPTLRTARTLEDNTLPAKRGRCCICPRAADTKTAIRCAACSRNACAEHSTVFCSFCLDDK
jgi:hypothetical protein